MAVGNDQVIEAVVESCIAFIDSCYDVNVEIF